MKLTIFTPTYNRASYLQRLYDSLLKQAEADFEWLIVDDGSTDNTEEVVNGFMEEKKILIRYHKKVNGGKHSAYNCALDLAAGDWFLCVDADDYLADDAISHVFEKISTLNCKIGIAAYKVDRSEKCLSDPFPTHISQCPLSDLSLRHNCSGEFTLIYPTQIAAKHKFPIFPGEKFIGECVVYDQIDQECPVCFLPYPITVCEYLADGYSNNFGSLMGRNPCGFCLYFLQRIDLQDKLLPRIIHASKYWCFRWISGNNTLTYHGRHTLLVALCVIPGVLFRIYYKLFRNI